LKCFAKPQLEQAVVGAVLEDECANVLLADRLGIGR